MASEKSLNIGIVGTGVGILFFCFYIFPVYIFALNMTFSGTSVQYKPENKHFY